MMPVAFHPAAGSRGPLPVALTFDDGPWPHTTAQILAVLVRQKAPATFFTVAARSSAIPSCPPEAGGRDGGRQPLLRASAAVRPAPGGPRPRRDRPRSAQPDAAGGPPGGVPATGGAAAATILATAQGLGERTVLWSVDPADWQPGVTADQLVWRVLAAARPGAIVLLHDGGGNRSATVAALPAIIDGLRRLGLTLTVVPG